MTPALVALLMVAAVVAVVLWRRARPAPGVVDPRAVAMWRALGQTRPCPRVSWHDAEPEAPAPYLMRWSGEWVGGYVVRGDSLINVVRGPGEVRRMAHELVHCTGHRDHDAAFFARVATAEAAA